MLSSDLNYMSMIDLTFNQLVQIAFEQLKHQRQASRRWIK